MFGVDTRPMSAAPRPTRVFETTPPSPGSTPLLTPLLTSRQLRRLDRERRQLLDAAWVSVTLPVEAIDPFEVLDGDQEDAVLVVRSPTDFDLGLGAATSLTAAGPQRFDRVAEQATALLESVRSVSLVGRPPAARLLGGFAFSPSDHPSAAFPNTWWMLPRLWLHRDRRGSTLTLTLAPQEDLEALLRLAAERLRARATGSVDSRLIRQQAPDFQQWHAEVSRVLGAIAAGVVTKVVCAGTTRLTLERPAAIGRVLARLSAPGAVRYAVRYRGVSLFGASPERLVALTGRAVQTEALAGTAPSGALAGAQLASSAKEQHEHAIVLDVICAALAPLCERVAVSPSPELFGLAQLQHLRTRIGAVTRARSHVLGLAARLHPTPAVGAAPAPAALSLLDDFATGRRGWYTGAVGSFDASGDGELQVALRCALARGSDLELWAGAGIVAGSDAEREYREVLLKTQTLLGAIVPPSARPSPGMLQRMLPPRTLPSFSASSPSGGLS